MNDSAARRRARRRGHPADAPDVRLAQLLALAEQTQRRRRPAGARDTRSRPAAIAAELGDDERRGEALYWEGCALDHLLEHDGALAAFQEALAIAETRADDPARARLLRSIGFTYDSWAMSRRRSIAT